MAVTFLWYRAAADGAVPGMLEVVGTPLIVLGWTVLVLANYLAGHPWLYNADWIGKAFIPPCAPWRAPFAAARGAELLRSAGILAAWAAAVFAAGHRLGRLVRLPAEEGAVRLLLGMGVAAGAMLGLGLAGIWFPPVVRVLIAAGAAVWVFAHGRRALAAAAWPGWWILLFLPAAWVTLAGAVSPETEFDPIRYHLGLPELFGRVHRIVVPERNIFASFPLNASMLFGSLELCGGQPAAKLLNWSLLWAGSWFAFTFAGGGGAGRLAALAWMAIPVVWVHGATAFAELTVTAFECGALLVLVAGVARGGGTVRLAAASGLLAGFALGSKYQAVQAAAPLFVLWFVLGRRWTAGAVFAVAAAVPVVPWLLKNWLWMGNPVHPIMAGVFPGLEDASRALAQSRFRPEEVMGGTDVWHALAAPWRQGLTTDRINSYPFGPVVVLSLPWLAAGLAGRSATLGWYAAGFVGAWAATTAGWGRYLIGALPAWVAAAAVAARRTDARMTPGSRVFLRAGAGVALVAGHLMGAVTVFQRQNPLEVAAGCVSPDRDLERRVAPAHRGLPALRDLCGRMAPGTRFYAYGRTAVAYVPRDWHCDYEYDTPLFQFLIKASRDPGELRKRFRQRGLAAFHYDMAGGVTQSEVAGLLPWTAREITLWQEFFRLYGEPKVRVESGGEKVAIYGWLLRRAPDPAGRLLSGEIWPHLPGLERALVEGDRLHARGDRAGARRYYEGAAEFLPGYAWAHQRVAALAREQGRAEAARLAEALLRRLGG